jgi:hypothetical protein
MKTGVPELLNLMESGSEALLAMDEGRIRDEMDAAIRATLRHIQAYPFRDDQKVEKRTVVLKLDLTPRLAVEEECVEGDRRSHKMRKVVLAGVVIEASVDSITPKWRSPQVLGLTRVRGGLLEAVQINPRNNDSPLQAELPFDDDLTQ